MSTPTTLANRAFRLVLRAVKLDGVAPKVFKATVSIFPNNWPLPLCVNAFTVIGDVCSNRPRRFRSRVGTVSSRNCPSANCTGGVGAGSIPGIC